MDDEGDDLKTRIEQAFGHSDLYAVLGVSRDATEQQLKKGYYKSCLQYHPDKATGEGREEAQKKFVLLSAVHELLSDSNRRAAYDETGEMDGGKSEDLKTPEEFQQWWEEYWRAMFPPVTVDAIEEFRWNYQGGAEEAEDVLKAYGESEGDMEAVVDSIMLATSDDIGRFVHSIILPAIEAGKVKRFRELKKYEKRPVIEPRKGGELKNDNGTDKNTSDALVKAIQARKPTSSDSALGALVQKYAGGSKKKSQPEPTEEEFAAARARLEAGRTNKRGKK